jgi:hypothetical protein
MVCAAAEEVEMRNLRATDGSDKHRRAARYHMGACRQGSAPLLGQLRKEIGGHYDALKAKARAVEDAEDDLADAAAFADVAEIDLENTVRDLSSELEKLDRKNPELNAQAAVFPHGYGEVIDEEGQAQLEPLVGLHTRLARFESQPALAVVLAAQAAAEAAFRDALKVEATAADNVETLFAEELELRRALREQLASAHGRLRDLYRARPVLAERYFLRDGTARRARPAPVTPPPGPPPAPGTPG